VAYEDVILYDLPSGYWRLDEASATIGRAAAGPELLTISAGTGPSVVTRDVPSAIVGDNGACAKFPENTSALSFLQTAPFDAGATCDPSLLSEFTIECWFKTDNVNPGATDNLIVGPTGTAMGGPAWRLQFNVTTGCLSIRARNAANTEVTATSGALAANRWYHVVGVLVGGNLLLYLDGVQVASVAFTGAFPATMIAASNQITLSRSSSAATGIRWLDEVAFYRTGLSAARILAHYQAGAQRGFPRSQLPGDRANAVLDSIASHAPRSIRTGTRAMTGAYMRGQPPLDELRAARSAENVDAMLFVSRSGAVVLLDAGHRAVGPWSTVQATFDDDGTDLPYMDLSVDYSETFLVNEWNVTRTDGLKQTASDATSIARYFKRSRSITDLPIILDADAADIATALLAKYKDPLTRITSIAFTTAIPDVTEAVLARELGDRIRVFRTPPGGGARIDQTLFIQHIHIEGASDGQPWRIEWGVSPR